MRVGRVCTVMLIVAVTAAVAPAQAAALKPCPMIGAVYGAGPHRLTMAALPRGADGSAIYTVWRFQSRDARGRVQSTLRMLYGCGNGRTPCSVSPESHPEPDGGYYSEVVGLNRDFSLTTGNDAPYALVLPGFATIDWSMAGDVLAADIVQARGSTAPPDFDNRVTWLRLHCGPRA